MKVNNKGHFKSGNSAWEKRSSIGRRTIFSNPPKMWKAFTEYCQWCEDNPWKKHEYMVVDKVLTEVYKETERPYSWAGFCGFIGTSEAYFRQFKKSDAYKNNPDFSTVISEIDSVMFSQKFEGAAVGAFNANIISRDLGLIDKTQSENININSVTLTKDEIKQYSDALKKEV